MDPLRKIDWKRGLKYVGTLPTISCRQGNVRLICSDRICVDSEYKYVLLIQQLSDKSEIVFYVDEYGRIPHSRFPIIENVPEIKKCTVGVIKNKHTGVTSNVFVTCILDFANDPNWILLTTKEVEIEIP